MITIIPKYIAKGISKA